MRSLYVIGGEERQRESASMAFAGMNVLAILAAAVAAFAWGAAY